MPRPLPAKYSESPSNAIHRATCRRKIPCMSCSLRVCRYRDATHACRCWPPTFGMAQHPVHDGVPLWAILLDRHSPSPRPPLTVSNPLVDMAWPGRSRSDPRSLVSDRGIAMRSSHVLASTVVLIRTTDNANRYGPGRDEAFRPSAGRRDLMAPDWILQGAFISSVSDLPSRQWRLRPTAGEVSVKLLFY